MNEQRQPKYQSQLFTLRLWLEEFGSKPQEVRIQVKHVLSGETCYFREWRALIAYLNTKLYEDNDENNDEDNTGTSIEEGER